MAKKKIDLDVNNERLLLMLTNNDSAVKPLIVLFPQWSKASIDKMPRDRQQQIYDEFAHRVSDAWADLLREG
jgi:hypothetical protein